MEETTVHKSTVSQYGFWGRLVETKLKRLFTIFEMSPEWAQHLRPEWTGFVCTLVIPVQTHQVYTGPVTKVTRQETAERINAQPRRHLSHCDSLESNAARQNRRTSNLSLFLLGREDAMLASAVYQQPRTPPLCASSARLIHRGDD